MLCYNKKAKKAKKGDKNCCLKKILKSISQSSVPIHWPNKIWILSNQISLDCLSMTYHSVDISEFGHSISEFVFPGCDDSAKSFIDNAFHED